MRIFPTCASLQRFMITWMLPAIIVLGFPVSPSLAGGIAHVYMVAKCFTSLCPHHHSLLEISLSVFCHEGTESKKERGLV